jgi:hypothetical protein
VKNQEFALRRTIRNIMRNAIFDPFACVHGGDIVTAGEERTAAKGQMAVAMPCPAPFAWLGTETTARRLRAIVRAHLQ